MNIVIARRWSIDASTDDTVSNDDDDQLKTESFHRDFDDVGGSRKPVSTSLNAARPRNNMAMCISKPTGPPQKLHVSSNRSAAQKSLTITSTDDFDQQEYVCGIVYQIRFSPSAAPCMICVVNVPQTDMGARWQT
ncbi:hypothetical protein T265_00052 [Opisthorchis viverrini]|uniref:Uncharacterized protein n=1 Tax=Opisthorchis viverrini TaxID=6198 RepID=A0A075A4B6_OPIVI|nr:hypothetical protein T265_00052 [Opisthorchis viverrini]KER34186.1 hypothetical protein T265_00052 [Opisthorchis viverrini]